MPVSPKYRAAIVLIETLCVAFLVLSVVFRSQRSGLPREFRTVEGAGAVTALNGTPVAGAEEIEFFLVSSRIGDSVTVTASSPWGEHRMRIQLIPLNSWPHILFYSSVAFLLWLLGFIVYRMKRDDPAAAVFHLTATCAAMATIASREISGIAPPLLGACSGVVFFLAYSFLPASFMHFMLLFPRMSVRGYRTLLAGMYGLAVVLAALQIAYYFPAVAAGSVELFRRSLTVSALFNIYLLAGFLGGLIRLARSYASAATREEKKKLRWIITGLIVGAGPYIFLWVLPKALFSRYLVSEEIFQAFLLVVPVTFAIAIMRYHLLDIDVIIQRGTVYTIVLGVLIGCYLLVVGGLALIVPSPGGVTPAIAAIVTALIFEPVRVKVRRIVDRRFFHVRYDIRETLPRFVEDIKDALDVRSLAMLIVARTNELIAPERIGFFTLQEPAHRLIPVAQLNFEMLEHHGVPFEVMKLRTQLRQPVALDDRIEPGSVVESADAETFRRWGIAIAFPMLSEKLEILGFLVLGPKKSGEKFSIEDVNLLKVITTQAGLALERIILQTKIVLEQEESRHLAELNQLKSYFVSSVSHDLKTPLSAIHMHAELLRSGAKMTALSKQESLEIIEGESERLAHLIDNVLDASRIDSGAKHYDVAECELNAIVKNVLRLTRYELKMKSFSVTAKLSPSALPISGDEIAIERAIVNLIGNAVKYSERKKNITIATRRTKTEASVSVTDRGIGISPGEQQRIFDRYYRSGDAKARFQPGVGLGLSIVRHVMDAHGGRVEVVSAPGRGSTFTLFFPRRKSA